MKKIKNMTPLAIFFAIFLWLEWIMHRQQIFIIILGITIIYTFLAQSKIAPQIQIRGLKISPLSEEWATAIYVLMPSTYFLIRGSGTSGVGFSVAALIILLSVGLSLLGPTLDRYLSGFYNIRNQRLKKPMTLIISLIIPILLAFIVVHGSLLDIVALFGGNTTSPQTPTGINKRIYFTVVASTLSSYFLLRDPSEDIDDAQ